MYVCVHVSMYVRMCFGKQPDMCMHVLLLSLKATGSGVYFSHHFILSYPVGKQTYNYKQKYTEHMNKSLSNSDELNSNMVKLTYIVLG